MKHVKILLVDDHELIINGIKSMLKSTKDFNIIGEAVNGLDAIKKTDNLNPDVIIMDISMPIMNGIEACKIIVKKYPNIKILALTQHEDNEYIIQMTNAGASGYLLKNSKKDEFIEAIQTVAAGKKYYSSKISELLLSNLITQNKMADEPEKNEVPLTKREIEIIRKIANEMSNQEIADDLHISIRTVETHRRNLMQKLNVNSVVSLIKYAAAKDLIKFN
ncbi:MAG: response regulator transcription factor [Bacteroidota bacterium]|jgi:DNA-binding NarL/FixJ family response regulator